jgi:maltose/moltooligosaccharide transporter
MRKKERNLRSLDMRRTLLVTLPFAGALAFWQAYDGIIPLILRDTFHLGDTLAGAVMALDNVCALFLLPFFGSISDRCHSRLGRRTPFILVGSLLAALLIPLLAVADQMRSLPFFFTVLCLVLVVLSSYRSPCVALMPDVTPRPIRAKADAFNSLMAAASGVVILISISLAVPDVEHPNYMPVFLIISAIIILCTVLFAVFFREKKAVEKMHTESLAMGISEADMDASDEGGKEKETDAVVRRSLLGILLCVFFYFMASNAVTSAFSKYASQVWGAGGGSFANFQLVATMVTLISYMPMANISCRIGRKLTTYIGIGLMCFGGFCIFMTPGYSPLIYVFVSISGVGMGTVATTIYPMIMEVASEKTTGRYTGYYYTASMSAQIITPILSGAVMEFIGYRYLYLYAIVCALLAALPLVMVQKGNTILLKDLDLDHPTGELLGAGN